MKQRFNIYLDHALTRRLDQAAVRLGGSKSAVVGAALASFFSPDGGDRRETAIARRLDRLTRQYAKLERNQRVTLDALALFVRHHLSVTAPLPAADRATALAKGEERFAAFIEQLGHELGQGKSLVRDMVDRVLPTTKDFYSAEEAEDAAEATDD